MKIAVAQTRPVKGEILINIENHKRLIDLARESGVDVIIFPELSLTGYEPGLAENLASNKDDRRLDDFQQISDKNNITIGVGMSIKSQKGIMIGMIIFQPYQPRLSYCKQHLHPDEDPYFAKGESPVFLINHAHKISLAICYELSVPEHSAHASANGADIYIASVAKSASGVEKAAKTLSEIAAKYSMAVLMSNCVGYCDNFESAGKTSVWNNKGVLTGQLDNSHEGILILDTTNNELTKKMI